MGKCDDCLRWKSNGGCSIRKGQGAIIDGCNTDFRPFPDAGTTPIKAQVSIMSEVLGELERANVIHPFFNSPHEGVSVIREEYLELEKEVFWGTTERAREEAIQLAAMCVKLIRFIDVKHGEVKGSESQTEVFVPRSYVRNPVYQKATGARDKADRGHMPPMREGD